MSFFCPAGFVSPNKIRQFGKNCPHWKRELGKEQGLRRSIKLTLSKSAPRVDRPAQNRIVSARITHLSIACARRRMPEKVWPGDIIERMKKLLGK